ncbi:unnamed protein product [Somion occarium]|uniref:Phospholipid/glycerol acyltransferase domain-containing protein n=1 Tax=Somion occarium TaxID=3059160 RepID=A0ABP1DT84_9APHY
MPLLLVYRALRKASEWMQTFYSDVLVEGQENVPNDGPLIIVANHHNELVDIATLAVTIPHRRPLRFWAKDSLFKVPVVRNILASSGAIPVHRNSISVSSNEKTTSNGNNLHSALFQETLEALDAGGVIGLFPEGTSYTHPHIPPLKGGVARVALEYLKWQTSRSDANGQLKHLNVVPVGIMYTDKSRYQSRVCVRFGPPVYFQHHASQYSAASADHAREMVGALTFDIEQSLRALTINAPNWDVYHAASVARDIIYENEGRAPLRSYVPITQRLINALNNRDVKARTILVKYYSLLYHANISHGSLSATFPYPTIPSGRRAFQTCLWELTLTIFHPRALLFLPPLLVHIPGYLSGYLGRKYLASTVFEETHAQFKAICGGVGFGLCSAFVSRTVFEYFLWPIVKRLTSRSVLDISAFGFRLKIDERVLHNVGLVATAYGMTWALFRWHHALVDRNYMQFKRLTTSFKVLIGVMRPASQTLSDSELAFYIRSPPKPFNRFLNISTAAPSSGLTPMRNTTHSEEMAKNEAGSLSTSALIMPLLAARVEATAVVKELVGRNPELII